MSVRSAGSTVVDRLLASPTRLDDQVAGVLFAVTFVGGCLLLVAARRLGRIVDVAVPAVGAVARSGSGAG